MKIIQNYLEKNTDYILLTYLVRLIGLRDFYDPDKHYNHPQRNHR
jgi:hypothetical protein